MEGRSGIGKILANIGILYGELGDYEAALKSFTQALQIFEEVEGRFDKGNVLSGIGMVHMDSGDYQKALSYFEQALEVFRELGVKSQVQLVQRNMGDVYLALGDHQKALEKYGSADSPWLIGTVYNKVGKYEGALERYRTDLYGKAGLRGELEIGRPRMLIEIYSGMGEALGGLGRYDEAVNAYIERVA